MKPVSNVNVQDAEITGEVMGGNLTVFCNMIGTYLTHETKGKILIFEDVNEKGYHVHRH